MSSPSARRLLKESSDLHKNPSPYFTAGPTSDSNLHDWHFTLAGPPSTPYAQGLYHGRITFPATYPLRPPSFRFLTPSGRFEVNREICLSISGHHEETWQPAWGVRTALLGIRSEIFGSESKGQVGGMEGSDEVRREYARLSLGWRCRECGVGNLEIMKEVWGVCRERGVEVDVEVGEMASEGLREEREEGVENDSSVSDTLPAVDAAPEQIPELQQTALQQISTQPPSSGQVPTTAAIPVQTSAQLATTETPCESVWLDRAIVAVIIALVVLVLRRVANVGDL
ncbi:hypothetical protein N7457_004299 [Penicillium paradoxum]|uniref:uncharacterized protein n=1 Tax=Penicillium paradoxum TaxID=176176 RepID=UPI0025489CBA|nr:uncharacterized protein N7457_004299 [Penicillium paradoxum]KAJ5782525.1 hypothetical protein N7457_004299 [Penicillium paradoxum]